MNLGLFLIIRDIIWLQKTWDIEEYSQIGTSLGNIFLCPFSFQFYNTGKEWVVNSSPLQHCLHLHYMCSFSRCFYPK